LQYEVFCIKLSCFDFSFVQISGNTIAPDSNSVLDLQATIKGFLVPRLSTTERSAMSNGTGFSQGMLVYDINLDVLFVGYGAGATGNVKWCNEPMENRIQNK
jgi:hypothetical protein